MPQQTLRELSDDLMVSLRYGFEMIVRMILEGVLGILAQIRRDFSSHDTLAICRDQESIKGMRGL
jgi:hypothetical protein